VRPHDSRAPKRPIARDGVGPRFLAGLYFVFSGHDEGPLNIVCVEPESWPLDPVAAAAMVAQVIEDIDASTEKQRRDVLEVFLSAAWGCRQALDQ
jgi:hypothetical protein